MMSPLTRNEELAWAAGFFDGEGCTLVTHDRSKRPYYARLYISQNDRVVLERFQRAIGGHGAIYRAPNGGIHHYSVGKSAIVRDILSLLWSWLGHVKRYQALEKLQMWWDSPPRYNMGACERGH